MRTLSGRFGRTTAASAITAHPVGGLRYDVIALVPRFLFATVMQDICAAYRDNLDRGSDRVIVGNIIFFL